MGVQLPWSIGNLCIVTIWPHPHKFVVVLLYHRGLGRQGHTAVQLPSCTGILYSMAVCPHHPTSVITMSYCHFGILPTWGIPRMKQAFRFQVLLGIFHDSRYLGQI